MAHTCPLKASTPSPVPVQGSSLLATEPPATLPRLAVGPGLGGARAFNGVGSRQIEGENRASASPQGRLTTWQGLHHPVPGVPMLYHATSFNAAAVCTHPCRDTC